MLFWWENLNNSSKVKGREWGIKWKGGRIKFNCSNITKPEDITSQCDYKDEFPGGRNDKNLVSCCQGEENSYNELKHFYESNFNQASKGTYGKEILESMCECCKKKGKEK